MPKLLKANLPALLILLLIISATPARSDRTNYANEVEQKILELTNAARRDHHLKPLIPDLTLIDLARAHSADMLKRHYFSHISPEGKSFQDRMTPVYSRTIAQAAENIWTGTGYTYAGPTRIAQIIVNTWMKSPGHRGNILNPNFNYSGVGISAMGKEIKATQNFIQRR